MSFDDRETPSARRGIYEGRDVPGGLFRGRERSESAGSDPARHRRPRSRWPWSVAFLAVVALYAIASTVYIVWRTPALNRRLTSGPPPRPPAGPRAVTTRSVPAPAPGPGAETVVRRLRDDEQGVRDTIRETDRMVARGMAREALDRIERRLAEAPDSLELCLGAGRILRSLGDAAAARDRFVTVLRADPSNVRAREGLAAVLLDLGDPDGALEAAQWAMDAGGPQLDVMRIAVRAAAAVGQYTVAAGHARVWLQQDPESAEAQDLLGLCHLRLGEYGKASYHLGELIRQGRGTEATYLNLVLAFAQQKQFNDVADLLMKAVQRLDRSRVVAWFGRPDFTVLREDPVVSAVVAQVLDGASSGVSLRLPEVRREPIGEPGIGMIPVHDLDIRRSAVF